MRSQLALLLAVTVGSAAASAQASPAAAVPPDDAATAAVPTAGAQVDSVIKLSPFEVGADKSNTYNALNSNSLTRFNTELDKLPVTADIYDQQFMTDVNATSVEDMIGSFTAGAGFASSSSSPDGAAATQQPLDRNGSPSLSLRGLAATAIERDGYFPPAGSGTLYTTTFDLERVEVILGPQSLLYGVGGGGGVINEVSKQARFDLPTFASFKYQLDEYGNKSGTFDFGAGNDHVAVRVAAISAQIGGRRVNIGGPLTGDYVQLAIRPVSNTTVRLQVERTTWNRMSNDQVTLTAASTSNDARNGQYLHYLLATNQIVAAANGGASGAGVIDNGHLNWDNVDSFGGSSSGEYTKNEFAMGQIDTVWNKWLSTEIAGGYDDKRDEKIGNSSTGFFAPNVTANPTGTWAAGQTSSTPFVNLLEPSRTKDLRISAVLTNELFDGKVKSQTVLGGDFSRVDSATESVEYVLADSNFNPVVAATTTHNGLTFMPPVYWSVANGPIEYPILPARAEHITYLGNNYVRALGNAPSASLVSPSNPEGLTGSGEGDFRIAKQIQKGVYAANFADWMDGKLTTLVGFRASSIFAEQFTEGSAAVPSVGSPSSASGASFNAGVNYAMLSWLRPYVEVSDSFNPPQQDQADPYGVFPAISRALGEEVGLKATNPAGTWSGSVALFHAYSKNEQFSFSSTLVNDINPSGLNGRFGAPSTWINVDRTSEGADINVTANPIPNLRMRLSMSYNIGTIGTAKSYAQLYNDQFHENSAGDVTYADGSVVYVNPTYNSKQLTVTSNTPGAIPLTVQAMSTPGNAYYANPVATTGQILSSTSAAKVLEVVDPVHGAILTGQTGLPISAIQINPGAALPGVIPITEAGDITAGFPRVGLNYTSVYTLRTGILKGLELGGTFSASWKRAEYYYYPLGITANPNYRVMYYAPMESFFNGIFGYERKIGRIDFLTQLNVGNIFNHYHVFTLPSYVNGWAGPDNATFDQEPRSYTWSTTVKF